MDRYIITVHSTADGKWVHNEHPEYGVYRRESTAKRKLQQLIEMDEVQESGIGMGTVSLTDEKLPYTKRNDYQYPMDKKSFAEMIKDMMVII